MHGNHVSDPHSSKAHGCAARICSAYMVVGARHEAKVGEVEQTYRDEASTLTSLQTSVDDLSQDLSSSRIWKVTTLKSGSGSRFQQEYIWQL